MKKNKSFIIACMMLIVGTVMLFGSSYSLITNEVVTEETFSFDVVNFDVEFQDSKKININGLPIEDEEGLKGEEYTFVVNNNSSFDVNYRLDIIENSPFTMSDVIRYTYSINDSEYSEIYNLKDNYTVRQNRVLKHGEKDIYKIKLWLSIEADETYMNKKFSASINLNATANEFKYATNVIEHLTNKKQDGLKLVDGVYRYVLKESLNYVWFNCKDNYTKGEDYCEKWRIIGSFDNVWNDVDEYKMLKITSNDIYDKVVFNNKEMNGDYKNSYINNYANGYYYDTLNEQAKELIIKSRFYIGDSACTNYSTSLSEEKSDIYYAYVGLLNPSDYLYLGKNNWLKIDGDIMLLNKNDGKVNILNNDITQKESDKDYSFMPVVNLKPDVSIVSGDGSVNSPYELGIKYPLNYGSVK